LNYVNAYRIFNEHRSDAGTDMYIRQVYICMKENVESQEYDKWQCDNGFTSFQLIIKAK
jgi:hypothetical protein